MVAALSAGFELALVLDDEHERRARLLLLDETESDALADRLPADAFPSSAASVSRASARATESRRKHQRVGSGAAY